MAASHYHLITNWKVEASPDEVAGVLADPLGLPRWWPEVYLSVEETRPAEFRIRSRGWLPYTLCWQFRVTEAHLPEQIALAAWGDVEGRGVWRFRADGRFTEVIYDWDIEARKPLLRRFSAVLKPVFIANHRWAMAKGEKNLQAEVMRLRRGRAEMTGSGIQSTE